jgi:Tfp pilus assembly protein PilX
MSRKRSRGILIAVVLITLIGVAGTRLYLVREFARRISHLLRLTQCVCNSDSCVIYFG